MRILRNLVLGTLSVVVIVVVSAAILTSWDRSHTYYPGLENKSEFLRTYSLKPAVAPYIAPPEGSGDGSGSGGTAGRNSVKHTANFGEYFAIRSERRGALMEAVDADLGEQLRRSRTHILSHSGASSTGFQFRYRSGNSVGSASIHPLEPGRVQRYMPLADGLEDVALTVDIEEEWFPKGIPAEVAQSLPELNR